MEQSILTKEQSVLLEKIGADDTFARAFYLTGGTALAAFYLGHRYSEDLDFFSTEEYDILALDVFFKRIKKKRGLPPLIFNKVTIEICFLPLCGGSSKNRVYLFPISNN